MHIKKILTLVVAASLLVVGVAAVSAQGPQEGRGLHIGQSAEIQALIEEYTGLTQEELQEALQDGSTLAELIAANGESVDDFIEEAVELEGERLDEAVEEGVLTEDEATEMLELFTENITARVNDEQPEFDGEQPEFGNGERPQLGDGEQPQFGNGEHPQPGDGEQPEFGNGEHPQPSDGEQPQFGNEGPRGGFGPFGGPSNGNPASAPETDS